jgi:hypothetical protein
VQFVENQGGWVPISRGSDGNIVAGSVKHNYRTPAYTQTDANLTHYVHVSKEHENRRLGGEINVSNLLGQHAITGYNEIPLTAATSPSTTSNPLGFDYHAMETGWDYVGVSNNDPINGKKLVSNTYGQPNLFQTGRQIRLKVAYVF